MAYNDATFNTTFQETVIGGGPALGVSLGSVTASATQTYTGTAGSQVNGTFRLPVFKNPINILGIRVYTTTAPASGVTGVTFNFLNGTATVGTAVASTTVGYVDAALTGSVTLASNGSQSGAVLFTNTTSNEMTMITSATGTASGSNLGSYSIDLIFRNLFTT